MAIFDTFSKLISILQAPREALAVSSVETGSMFIDEMLSTPIEKMERHPSAKGEARKIPGSKNEQKDSDKPLAENKAARKFFSIGVLGAKGGVGSSTIALNLAIAMSKNGLRSTVLDANLQQPDIAVMLGRQPEHSISEFVSRRGELDDQLWNACCMPITPTEKNSGTCTLLSGPANGEAARQTSLSHIAQSFASLQAYSDVLVVDLPKNLDKHLVTALDRLDYIVLVFDGTLAAIAAARRWKNIFAELAYPANKIIYVENRGGAKSQQALPDSRSLLAEVAAKLPNAYAFIEECCNSAEPAVLKNPKQAFSRAISSFAEQLNELAKTRLAAGGNHE